MKIFSNKLNHLQVTGEKFKVIYVKNGGRSKTEKGLSLRKGHLLAK
ncbi:hypothetical protein [Cytobacillus dafuensis]|nr:hypothetical protein [Cytobacillus dafuensis]